MKESLRVLLDSLIDYAGLFPPASLPMAEAVRRFQQHRDGEFGWALGRLVVPLANLAEVPLDIPVSVVVARNELSSLHERVDVIETKAANVDDIDAIAGVAGSRMVYVEVTDVDLIESLRGHGMRAKIRTGGVTQEAFPEPARVARFIRECAAVGVAFKATAGLHHPIRCSRPLTYEPNAPTGVMHGFINLFVAAALVGGAEEVLLDQSPESFDFEDDAVSWRGRRVVTADLARLRREFAISFGSCSFHEPIDDLKDLGWL
jgi:hypothetical protein